MSHRFGDLLTQFMHRKHGLSQAKLAAGVVQSPSIISEMCQGRRLSGPQARERVIAIISWLREQGVLQTVAEANALLDAAMMAARAKLGEAAFEATYASGQKMTLEQAVAYALQANEADASPC